VLIRVKKFKSYVHRMPQIFKWCCMTMASRFCFGFSTQSFFSSQPHRLLSEFVRSDKRCIHSTMTCQLNRFLFDPEETCLTDSDPSVPTVILPQDDYRTIHAAKILGLKNGDTIRAGIVGSGESPGRWTDDATVEWIPLPPVKKPEVLKNGNPPGSLSIRLNDLISFDAKESSSDDSKILVSLILALPRPLQLGRILPMISQLGVDQLVLTSAKKVPRDYFGSHLFRKPQVLRERLIEGLCQAGDCQLPKLHVIRNLRTFLADDLDRMFPRETYARVLAHPKRMNQTKEPLRMGQIVFPTTSPARIVLAVGPEGGWEEPEELEVFQELGFQQVAMGTRTLRSDCAVIGLLSLAHDVCHAQSVPLNISS
jgi:RsmE family RNA methyltransferase